MGPRLVVFLPDAFSLLCGSAFEATAHDEAHNAFMTLPAYTRTSEGKVHQLGSGPTPCRLGRCVSNSSRSASSEPLPEKSKSIERACEGTSAGDPARSHPVRPFMSAQVALPHLKEETYASNKSSYATGY